MTVDLVSFRLLLEASCGEIGIELGGRNTLVCVILCNNIRIDIKWERSPVGIN
jgi:hypothetical protein